MKNNRFYIIIGTLLTGLLIYGFVVKGVDRKFKDEVVFSRAYAIHNPEVLTGSNSTLLWQGFYHQWYINHRLNRLGDMIEDVQVNDSLIQARLIHTAASGSAADVLDYTSFFTHITTQNALFAPSSVNLHVYGKEGEEISKIVRVKGKYAEEMRNFKNAVVVFNGLDIRSSTKEELLYGNGKADKLITFMAGLDNFRFQNGNYEFMIDLKFNADCDSPECIKLGGKSKSWFDYQVKIGYQVIFYNDKIDFTETTVSNAYSWEKKNGNENTELEIHRDDLGFKNQEVKLKQGFTHALPMIDRVEIHIPKASKGKNGSKEKALHLLALDMALPSFNFNPLEAVCSFDACLFFKNWTFNMHPLSYTTPGAAYLNMGVKVMQINDKSTRIESHQVSDRIDWKTHHLKQMPSTDDKSVSEKLFIKGL